MALHEVKTYRSVLPWVADSGPVVWQPTSVFWGAAVYGQVNLALGLAGTLAITEQPRGAAQGLRCE